MDDKMRKMSILVAECMLRAEFCPGLAWNPLDWMVADYFHISLDEFREAVIEEMLEQPIPAFNLLCAICAVRERIVYGGTPAKHIRAFATMDTSNQGMNYLAERVQDMLDGVDSVTAE